MGWEERVEKAIIELHQSRYAGTGVNLAILFDLILNTFVCEDFSHQKITNKLTLVKLRLRFGMRLELGLRLGLGLRLMLRLGLRCLICR